MGLSIRLIAPDGLIWNTPIQEVVLPTTTGQIGLLEGHAPLITALEIGVLRIKIDQKWKPILHATAQIDERLLRFIGLYKCWPNLFI